MNPSTVGEKGEANLLFEYSFFRVLFQNVKCQSSLNINCVNFVNLLLTIGCCKYRITARGENQAVFMKNSRFFFAFSWLQTNTLLKAAKFKIVRLKRTAVEKVNFFQSIQNNNNEGKNAFDSAIHRKISYEPVFRQQLK